MYINEIFRRRVESSWCHTSVLKRRSKQQSKLSTYQFINYNFKNIWESFFRANWKIFRKKLSPKLCCFRKGNSTQYALLNLLKNWQKTLDKSGVIGTILMDLSKAYDCLPHDLVIAKLAAYGCKDSTTSLISDYLSKRYKRVKIGFLFLT